MVNLQAQLFEVAAKHGDRLAVDAGKGSELTYEELFTAAYRLALQIGDAQSVGILSNRRMQTYPAVLASFLSGKTFVPLNPNFPLDRLIRIAELAEVDCLLADDLSSDLARVIGPPAISINDAIAAGGADGWRRQEERVAISGDAIAYKMFTSGSTGEPKGVPISYGALDHYVTSIRRRIEFPPGARFSQCFDLSFDLAMHDIFVSLSSSGTLVAASEIDLLLPHRYVEKRRIDVWFSVPMLGAVAARGVTDKPMAHLLQLALFCGEPLPLDIVAKFRFLCRPVAPIFNLYGPTEATIAITARELDESEAHFAIATLGEPFGENKVAILDDAGAVRYLDEDWEGELLLGGPQVFDGYNPEASNPFVYNSEGRWYKSGDRVRFSHGKLHHLGRIDTQVKLRGHRIELGEIEAQFRLRFGCSAAAAIIQGEAERAEINVFYERQSDIEDVSALAQFLPQYMIPAHCWRLDALPLNANGKIDRRRLSELTWQD